jgi:hypothetical protein
VAHEFVVPRSMPIALPILSVLSCRTVTAYNGGTVYHADDYLVNTCHSMYHIEDRG